MLTEGSSSCLSLGQGDTKVLSVHLGMHGNYTAKFEQTMWQHSGVIMVMSPNKHLIRLSFA